MPLAFLTLIGFQLLGEVLRQVFGLPLPGPVIGMFLLAAVLVFRQRGAGASEVQTPPAIAQTANSLITHMGLLFVPAGVGIMTQTALLRHAWLPIVVGVIGSTLLSLVITGLVLHHISKSIEMKTSLPSPRLPTV